MVPERYQSIFNNFLALILYFLVPWSAINLVDYYFVRRGSYSVVEIFNPASIYGRWGWRGLTAYLLGFWRWCRSSRCRFIPALARARSAASTSQSCLDSWSPPWFITCWRVASTWQPRIAPIARVWPFWNQPPPSLHRPQPTPMAKRSRGWQHRWQRLGRRGSTLPGPTAPDQATRLEWRSGSGLTLLPWLSGKGE